MQEAHAAAASRARAQPLATWDPLAHQPVLWTRAHHAAQDHWADAVQHLGDALQAAPQSSELAWLLAQLYLAANKGPKVHVPPNLWKYGHMLCTGDFSACGSMGLTF